MRKKGSFSWMKTRAAKNKKSLYKFHPTTAVKSLLGLEMLICSETNARSLMTVVYTFIKRNPGLEKGLISVSLLIRSPEALHLWQLKRRGKWDNSLDSWICDWRHHWSRIWWSYRNIEFLKQNNSIKTHDKYSFFRKDKRKFTIRSWIGAKRQRQDSWSVIAYCSKIHEAIAQKYMKPLNKAYFVNGIFLISTVRI